MLDNIFYIHTTSTIIDYITALSKRYIPDKRIFHILDESMLFDIRRGDITSAHSKLENIIRGAVHSGAQRVMVTCTSTGQLIDSLDDELKAVVVRLEKPALVKIGHLSGNLGVVYTNPTVWPEMQILFERAGISGNTVQPCYIAGAFDSLLTGDTPAHDTLIDNYLQEHSTEFDAFLLAQVSICSAKERLGTFRSDAQILSMAELGIKSLKENSHA